MKDVLLHFIAVGTLKDHLVVSYTDTVFFEVIASCTKKASFYFLVPSFFYSKPRCEDILLFCVLKCIIFFLFFFYLWLREISSPFLFFIVSLTECDLLLLLIRWPRINLQLICQNFDLFCYLTDCGQDSLVAKTYLRSGTIIWIHLLYS